MNIVCHRAKMENASGAENSPELVQRALDAGFYAEVDLWFEQGAYFFGHSEAGSRIDLPEWDNERLFFHMKNAHIPPLKRADFFFIDSDAYALTARGRLWTNFAQTAIPASVLCAPELVGADDDLRSYLKAHQGVWGVCTDFPFLVREFLEA